MCRKETNNSGLILAVDSLHFYASFMEELDASQHIPVKKELFVKSENQIHDLVMIQLTINFKIFLYKVLYYIQFFDL